MDGIAFPASLALNSECFINMQIRVFASYPGNCVRTRQRCQAFDFECLGLDMLAWLRLPGEAAD